MKNGLLILFLSLAIHGRSQGNLQFNQVLTLGGTLNAGSIATNAGTYLYGSVTYTVPAGKVWKIENASSNNQSFICVNNFIAGGVGSLLDDLSPIWLKSGDALRIGNGSNPNNSYFFSIIEFNVVP